MKLATGARQLVAGPTRERVEAHARAWGMPKCKVPADSHETAKKAHMPLKSCVCVYIYITLLGLYK